MCDTLYYTSLCNTDIHRLERKMTLALSVLALCMHCMHRCMYMCVFLDCAPACMHRRPHHPLTHQIYGQWCVYTRQYCRVWRAPPPQEQSDLNGLLHLCQSLQDLLKYCGGPLGGRDKDVGLEQYVQAFRCVCVCVCVHGTEHYYICICHVTSCETYPTTTMSIALIPSCTWMCV